MRFVFTVEVELDRDTGPFVSKDDLAGELEDALGNADPGTVDIDESSYSVSDWSVTRDLEAEKPRRAVR